MIPFKLHYCWFGRKPIPSDLRECIASWRRVMPEYEIFEWNEDNYTSESLFFQENLRTKRYAFASDYARFDILNQHGGVYLDTDMFAIRHFGALHEYGYFVGMESDTFISCGVIGSEKANVINQTILNILDEVQENSTYSNYTIVRVFTEMLSLAGVPIEPSVNNEMAILNKECFYPYEYSSKGSPFDFCTDETYAVHLWNASWYTHYNRAMLYRKKHLFRKAFRHLLLSFREDPANILRSPLFFWELVSRQYK